MRQTTWLTGMILLASTLLLGAAANLSVPHGPEVGNAQTCPPDSASPSHATSARRTLLERLEADSAAAVVVDDADRRRVQITAYWAREAGESLCAPHRGGALQDGGTRADGVVRFLPALKAAGSYRVYLYWPSLRNAGHELATNVPVGIHHAGGSKQLTLDQRATPHQWTLLGTYHFTPDEGHYVEIRNDAADGHVVADAVMLVPVVSERQ